jgi:hypothetical protein
MFIISGGKGTGKTRELLEKAKATNGVVACENPTKLTARAYEYGIFGLTFIHYDDVAIFNVAYPDKKNSLYIHDINKFIRTRFPWVQGYSVSFDDTL